MFDLVRIDDLKPGQRVSWDKMDGHWITTSKGEIKRLTSSTVWVQPDHGRDLITRRANREGKVDLHVLTAHELAIEEWHKLEPTTEIVRVTEERDAAKPVAKVRIDTVRAINLGKPAAEVLAQITDECARLARWLAERPTPPPEERT